MSTRAIYAYAWDIEETGVDAAVAAFKTLTLNTVTIAGSYHAGKFLRPHGEKGKVYFPQDGTVYFEPRADRYGRIKPVRNAMLDRDDIVARLAARTDIATNVWLVLLHNTLLGTTYPDATVENAFGDRYVYSLCPSHPDARAYGIGLARDAADRAGVTGLSIESPGFAPYAHGFHHEFALNKPNRWLENQLGLCFCDHCRDRFHKATGETIEPLRKRVAADITAYLGGDLDFPDDMAEAFWMADTRTDGEMKAFLDWRCTVVTSLVAEIRNAVSREKTVAIIPSVARPTAGAWYEGSDLKALADAAGTIEACFYENSATRIAADAFDVKRRLGGVGRLRGILRPAWPDLESSNDLLEALHALRRLGIEDVAFYNWGHLRRRNLRWIADAFDLLESLR